MRLFVWFLNTVTIVYCIATLKQRMKESSFFICCWVRNFEIDIFVSHMQCSIDIFHLVGPIFESFGSIFRFQSIFQDFGRPIAANIRAKLIQTMRVQLLHVTQKLDGNLNRINLHHQYIVFVQSSKQQWNIISWHSVWKLAKKSHFTRLHYNRILPQNFYIYFEWSDKVGFCAFLKTYTILYLYETFSAIFKHGVYREERARVAESKYTIWIKVKSNDLILGKVDN